MKKFIFLTFFLSATTVSAEVLPVESVIAPNVPIVVEIEEVFVSTTTEAVPEIVVDTATTSTSTPVIATTTEVTETISIIPGSISLKLSSTVPIEEATTSTSTPATEVSVDDGLFEFIYTGFEEFVFKVFGI